MYQMKQRIQNYYLQLSASSRVFGGKITGCYFEQNRAMDGESLRKQKLC
jgi:hypothetical protein